MDNPQTSTCSAADLTDDLIVEILSRLPPKSICRFKCVSWHWYGLVILVRPFVEYIQA
jgi:hypothetical protein